MSRETTPPPEQIAWRREAYLRCLSCSDKLARLPEALLCSQCGRKYPVVNGIPRFVDANNYAESFGMQWNRHRRTQLDSYTGISLSRERLFRATGGPKNLNGQVVLEAGSGAGRFSEVLLAAGARVVSFDISAAVEANRLNNGNHPNLVLLQANIFDIPVSYAAFDKVLCLGVIQHTPDPSAAFRSLCKHVRPGGELVIDVYPATLTALLSWKYLLRPITKRMDEKRLYSVISRITPPLVPLSIVLTRLFGRAGARLLPIVQYSHLGLPPELNRDWAVLDTFDMYSPAHDHPQTRKAVRRWYEEAGLIDVMVEYGLNGIVGRGRRAAK